MSQPVDQNPSLGWELFKGFSASTVEVFATGQAFTYAKNQFQQKQLLSRDPRAWYRGVHYHAACLAPVTAIQFAAFQALAKGKEGEEVSMGRRTAAAFSAGAFGGFFATAAELGVVEATGRNIPVAKAIKGIAATRGTHRLFTTGLSPVIPRDAIFVWGYKEGKTLFANQIQSATGCSKEKAEAGGTVVAGIVSSYVSQPLDALRGIIQANWNRSTVMSMKEAAKILHQRAGLRAFWSGGLLRAGRVVFAIKIYEEWDRMMEQIKNGGH